MNMMIAEGQQRASYWSPKGLPSDVTNIRAASKYVVTMTSPRRSSPQSWFTNNELSQITPMPAAWDRTGLGAERLRDERLGVRGGVQLPELAGDQEPVDLRRRRRSGASSTVRGRSRA